MLTSLQLISHARPGLATANAAYPAPPTSTPLPEGLPAVLHLCWAILLASSNPAQHRQEAGRCMAEAQAAGAFRALRKVRAGLLCVYVCL